MPKRKRGITGDVASRREAIKKRERRVVETEEERSRRLSTMAQRGQDRRVEETEEQRNSRLSDMAQRGQERRAEETEEQRKENTFWGERNVYPKVCASPASVLTTLTHSPSARLQRGPPTTTPPRCCVDLCQPPPAQHHALGLFHQPPALPFQVSGTLDGFVVTIYNWTLSATYHLLASQQ
ncbi:hypothetical protein AVEN_113653-1, partial [Araneus ventricosus]